MATPPVEDHKRMLNAGFKEYVAAKGDAVALEYLPAFDSEIHKFTYSELDARAKVLAEEIRLLANYLDDEWKPTRGSQRVVPFFLPSGPEIIIGMLAALEAGCGFSPVPVDAPFERIKDILADVQAPFLIGSSISIPWAIGDDSVAWLDMANFESWPTRQGTSFSPAHDQDEEYRPIERCMSDSEDIAYVLFTSGSTGKPKGVMLPHRAVVSCCATFASRHGPQLLVTESEDGPRALRWFATCTPSWDLYELEVWTTLGQMGGTLCIAERQLVLTDIERCIRTLDANVTCAVPSLAMLFRPERVPGLMTVVTGGELMKQRVIDNFSRGNKRVINTYAPTETAIAITSAALRLDSRTAHIGELFEGTKAYIIDADSEEAREIPVGINGELALAGPQVALGYINRPVESAAAFVHTSDGQLVYRTGDKVRAAWTPDGTATLLFLGRINGGQVKLNGRRTELSEIETVLATKVDAVLDAAVAVCDNKWLVACVAPRSLDDIRNPNIEVQCREAAARYLPQFMQPTYYMMVPRLAYALTSGKIDRKTTTAMAEGLLKSIRESTKASTNDSGYNSSNSSSHMSSSVEKMNKVKSLKTSDVHTIIREGLAGVLENKPGVASTIGSTTLHDVGLESLSAMVLLQTLRESGICELYLQDLLGEDATIDKVVSLIQRRRDEKAGEEVDTDMGDIEDLEDEEDILSFPVEARLRHFDSHCRQTCMHTLNIVDPTELAEVLPTMASQNHMLVTFEDTMRAWKTDPSVAKAYIEHFVYQVPPMLDSIRLQHAVDAVVRQHDSFRTLFVKIDHPLGPYAQCVLSPSSPRGRVPVVQTVVAEPWRDEDDSNSLWQHAVVNAQKSAEASIQLDRPGLVVSWVRTAENSKVVLIMSLFHPCYDGVAFAHLCGEIMTEYHKKKKNDPVKVSKFGMRKAVEVQLATDWVQRRFFWMMRLAGKSHFHLGSKCPTPLSPDAPQTRRPDTNFEYESGLSRLSLEELSTKARAVPGTTALAFIQAAWAVALARTKYGSPTEPSESQIAIEFGSVLHGRLDVDSLTTIAPMLATVPVRLVIDTLSASDEGKGARNQDICRQLAQDHAECFPYQQIPCPTLDMIKTQLRFDTTLMLQRHRFDDRGTPELPGCHWHGNRLEPFREMDDGFAMRLEVFEGSAEATRERMVLRCSYNSRKPGYEFLTAEWAQGMVSAFDSALVRMVEDPDGFFGELVTGIFMV